MARIMQGTKVSAEAGKKDFEAAQTVIPAITNVAQIDMLASHADYYVRMMVAKNPNISRNVTLRLAQDASVLVRSSLARHTLRQDILRVIWNNAAGTSMEFSVAMALLGNPNTLKTPEVLQALLTHADHNIKHAAERALANSRAQK